MVCTRTIHDDIKNCTIRIWYKIRKRYRTELLKDYPRALLQQPDLIMTPSGQKFLMHQGIPQLITWPISGNPIHQKDFLQRLQISCSPHGDPKQTPIMVPPLPDGLAGVSKGIKIPFRDL